MSSFVVVEQVWSELFSDAQVRDEVVVGGEEEVSIVMVVPRGVKPCPRSW